VSKEGEVAPLKDLEPYKGAKIAKRAPRKNMMEGSGTEMDFDHRPRVSIWNLSLELDGAPLPLDSSIREFQKGNVGYVADTLEQPLLLPQDMTDLRTLKKHKVFLTLKRDLAMVCTSTYFMYHTHIYFVLEEFNFFTIPHTVAFFQAIQTNKHR